MPFLFGIKSVSDFPRHLRRFLLEFREQFKECVVLKIHVLRSDNAQEFKSAEVLKILDEEKILSQEKNFRMAKQRNVLETAGL